MPRGFRKKARQYDVLDQFQEEDPEEFFQYKTKSTFGLTQEQMELQQAIDGPSPHRVESLLNRGIDPNFFFVTNHETPLHVAIRKKIGYKLEPVVEKIIGLLLFFGADPNAMDKKNRTPLHDACALGRKELVETLIHAGADVNAVDEAYDTPLQITCGELCHCSYEIAKTLILNGADISLLNIHGRTALHTLASNAHPGHSSLEFEEIKSNICGLLLQQGQCAVMPDERGQTPLTLLVVYTPLTRFEENDNAPMLETLIQGGAVMDCHQLLNKIPDVWGAGAWYPRMAVILARLLAQHHPLLPRHILQESLASLPPPLPGTMRNDLEPLVAALEESLATRLSLAQSCRLSIRERLGGYVLSRVHQLPLPTRLRTFLIGLE